jgi:hypothetical protein
MSSFKSEQRVLYLTFFFFFFFGNLDVVEWNRAVHIFNFEVPIEYHCLNHSVQVVPTRT